MKKIAVLFLVVSLLMLSIVYAQPVDLNFSHTEKDSIDANKDNLAQFRLINIRQDPVTASPGSDIDIYMAVDNVGGDVVGPVFSFVLGYPFSLEQDPYANYPRINSGDRLTFHYKIRVDKNAAPGDYEEEFRAYPTPTKYYPTFFNIHVDVVGSDFDTALQDVTKDGVSVAISNVGKNNANSITVRTEDQDNFGLLGSPSHILGNLNQGDYTVVSFLVKPKKDVPPNSVLDLKLHIDYTDTVGNRRTVEKDVPIVMTPKIKNGFNDLATLIVGDGTYNKAKKTTNSNLTYEIIGLVALILIALYFYKRKKKKKHHED